MRMPRIGVEVALVRIFSSRIIGCIAATLLVVRVYARINPSQMRIRLIHAL